MARDAEDVEHGAGHERGAGRRVDDALEDFGAVTAIVEALDRRQLVAPQATELAHALAIRLDLMDVGRQVRPDAEPDHPDRTEHEAERAGGGPDRARAACRGRFSVSWTTLWRARRGFVLRAFLHLGDVVIDLVALRRIRDARQEEMVVARGLRARATEPVGLRDVEQHRRIRIERVRGLELAAASR